VSGLPQQQRACYAEWKGMRGQGLHADHHPLVLLLFRKARYFLIAMETKGFGAPIEPAEIETLSARWVDYLRLLLIVAVFVVCTVIKFTR